jgi:hypothetical protein
MAIQMRMDWDGVTADQYDKVRELCGWEVDVPDGAVAHVAAFDESGAHICDIWDSAEAFDTFVANRLMAAVAEAGITNQPNVTIYEAHAVFIP